jgi:putative ABC transport system permease protein
MAMRSRLPVGLRRLASNAGPTLVAVALLGVALGTAAAAFSILHATVLNPLPFAAQDELAMIWQSDLQRDLPVSEIAYRNYVDLRERTRTFADLTAFGSVNWNLDLIQPGPSARIPLAAVTGSFFSVLQVPPLLAERCKHRMTRPAHRWHWCSATASGSSASVVIPRSSDAQWVLVRIAAHGRGRS